ADEAVAAADTLLLTVPNQMGVDYNAHVIESVLTHLAPELGWREGPREGCTDKHQPVQPSPPGRYRPYHSPLGDHGVHRLWRGLLVGERGARRRRRRRTLSPSPRS